MHPHIKAICAALVLLASPCFAEGQTDPFALLFGEEASIDVSSDGQAGQDDVRFLGLQLGDLRLSDTITAYAFEDGLCLLPTDLLKVLEAPVDVTENGVSGWFVRETATINIDISLETLRLSGRPPLDISAGIRSTQDGWCLLIDTWARVLPIDFEYDQRSLRLTLDPRETLPVEARLEREALRSRLTPGSDTIRPNYRKIENPYRLLSLPTADISLDVRAASAGDPQIRGQVELSADILWTTARIRSAQNLDGSQGLRVTLDRVFDENSTMLAPRQIQFGDISGLNQPLMPPVQTARGGRITNRAPFRADIFDITEIRGPLPQNWEAELYRDGQLIDYVIEPNELGEYNFTDIEIRPGYNRFTVKLFGPYGETDTRHVKFFAGAEMNPENTVEYDFALYESGVTIDGNQTSDRSLVGAASLSAGLRQNLSARLDIRATPNEVPWTVASLAGAAGETNGVVRILASSPYGPGFEVSAAHLFRDRSSLEARYIWLDAEGAPSDQETLSQKQALQLDYSSTLPFTRRGLPLQSRLVWSEGTSGDRQLSALARVSASLRGWRWNHTTRFDHNFSSPMQGTRFGGRIGFAKSYSGLRIRAGLDYELAPQLRLAGIEAGIQGRLSKSGFYDLNLNHDTFMRQTSASASLTRRFGNFALSATGGINTSGDWTAGLRLSTALFFDRRARRYRTAAPGITRTGAIRAHVFDDFDEDGSLSAPDAAQEGANFILDRAIRRDETDAKGRVILGNIQPHRTVDLELGLGSLSDPFLQPIEKGVAVTLRPGQIIDVDVPLAPSGEIEATVLLQNGETQVPVSGVRLQALNTSGEIVAMANTEYDGYVYLDALPLTDLTLRIAPEALSEINATAKSINVQLNRDSPSKLGMIFLIEKNQ